jgi:DNA-binding protein HU-beta
MKQSGKKTKPAGRSPLANTGGRSDTTKTTGAKKGRKSAVKKGAVPKPISKKKAARKTAVTSASRGTKQARKSATAKRTSAIAKKAAGPLPKKMTAQKKRAALSSPKPASEVGVREVQSTAPAVPVAAGEAPNDNPASSGGESGRPEARENDIE